MTEYERKVARAIALLKQHAGNGDKARRLADTQGDPISMPQWREAERRLRAADRIRAAAR